MSPIFWDIFDRAGLALRQSDAPKMVHLYAAGRHVGWTTQAHPGKGIEAGQLGLVRQVAHELQLGINAAATTLDTVRALLRTSPVSTDGGA